MYVSLNSVALQSALIWYFCYHSALVSWRLSEVSDVTYALPWHYFSIKSQKCIMMMLRQSNKYFVYRGFGILQCDLPTLKMVCNLIFSLAIYRTKLFFFQMLNSVVSYYLLLKKI